MADIRIFIFAVVGFIAGLLLFFMGFSWLKKKKLIEALPTSKIRSMAMGMVEIYGEAVPSKNDALKSPFSNKDCVYYRYTIEEYRKSGKNSRWVTLKSGSEEAQFFLKDDTGTIRIDPARASIDIPMDFEYNSSLGKDLNEHIKKFLTRNNMGFEGFLSMNKTMRYREYFIAPKDKLYIIGTAKDNPHVGEATAAKGHEDMIISKEGNDFYYISDRPERDIVKKFRWKVTGGLFGGGILIIGSLTAILFYFNLF